MIMESFHRSDLLGPLFFVFPGVLWEAKERWCMLHIQYIYIIYIHSQYMHAVIDVNLECYEI